MRPTLIVLAAGLGSRYGGLKQMDPLGPRGESIIDYSVYDAARAGFGKVIFVLREEIVDDFFSLFANKYKSMIAVDYVIQRLEDVPVGIRPNPERVKPWGTGHAMLAARDKINEPFAVINGDDFYGFDAFRVMGDFLSNADPGDVSLQAMVGYILRNTLSEHGHVSRGICSKDDHSFLSTVTERTHIQRSKTGIEYIDENEIAHPLTGDEIVSMNFWGFTPAILAPFYEKFVNFMDQRAGELKSEYFIPLGVNQLIQDKKLNVKVLESNAQWFGVTYKEDKPAVISKLNQLSTSGAYPVGIWA